MAEYKHWRLEKDLETDNELLWLTFDREAVPVNSLSREVFKELDDILNTLVANPPKGLALLSGKKTGFIAGADISQFVDIKTADEAFELIRQAQMVLDKLEAMPFPTVACIHGFCLGGGTELALACRYRIATDDPSTKIGLPEVNLGIHPGWGGTVRLPLRVGVIHAMQVMLTGRSFSGSAMAKMGAVDACVPLRELKSAARYYLVNKPRLREPTWYQRLPNLSFLRQFVGNIFYGQLKKKKVNKLHYPAPYAIVRNWIRDGAHGNAMINEAKSIAELMVTDTARNLVRIFFLQTAMKNAAKGSTFNPLHVHVVGAGTMGGDIAAYCAYKGFYVTLQDQSAERIAPAIGRAYKLFEKKLKKPNLIQQAMDRLQPDIEGRGMARADLIIEAVFENVDVKRDIFRKAEAMAKPTAILATNTSTILLEDIAEGLKNPERLVGIHFFNPVAKMQLVEVIRGVKTSHDIVRDAAKFVTRISRSPVVVKSSPGFLINRILMPYLMEAMQLLEEGYSAQEIDYAATQFGMPMGPITLADVVGLDICLHAATELLKTYGGHIPDRLKAMVAAKNLGVKSGRGFYEYKNGKAIKSAAESTPRDLRVLQDRLILIMVNEAVACLHEKIVESSDILDVSMIFGTGFAPFRGGPIHYAQERGYVDVLHTLESLAKTYGERFKPRAGWDALMQDSVLKAGPASQKAEVAVDTAKD